MVRKKIERMGERGGVGEKEGRGNCGEREREGGGGGGEIDQIKGNLCISAVSPIENKLPLSLRTGLYTIRRRIVCVCLCVCVCGGGGKRDMVKG